MDTDRNLLFGVLALQAELIDQARFAEACAAWAARKDVPLSDLLVERSWITPEDRTAVESVLERKLKKHGGNARASLAEVAPPPTSSGPCRSRRWASCRGAGAWLSSRAASRGRGGA